MNKAHPFASALYIGTGFAHINRVANVARFIWVNMKKNYEEKTRRDLDNSCMDNAAAFNIYI